MKEYRKRHKLGIYGIIAATALAKLGGLV